MTLKKMRVRQNEPEVSTREQAEFDWAHTWMEGISPALAESEAQGLLAQVFGSSRPLSLLFCSVLYFSVLAHDHILGYPTFLVE